MFNSFFKILYIQAEKKDSNPKSEDISSSDAIADEIPTPDDDAKGSIIEKKKVSVKEC